MNQTIKHALLKASDHLPAGVRHQAYRAVMALGRDESFPSVYATLAYLKKWGFSPERVVDVGAYHGEWTQMVRALFPGVEVIMVEPQQSKRALLKQVQAELGPHVTLKEALLGATEGEPVEFVEMESGSSVFEEISNHYPRNVLTKRTSTLDSLVRSTTGWSSLDFLKLDVQGYELEVLQGASELLPNTEFVLMETSVVPQNRGCPVIEDVFAFMTTAGFRMLDFCGQWRLPNHALAQTDLLFINVRSVHAPNVFLDHAAWMARRGFDASSALDADSWR